MKNILGIVSQGTRRSFIYESESGLRESQRTLVELGFHCITFAGKIKLEQRHHYYNILVAIFQRGELDLEAIGIFDETLE